MRPCASQGQEEQSTRPGGPRFRASLPFGSGFWLLLPSAASASVKWRQRHSLEDAGLAHEPPEDGFSPCSQSPGPISVFRRFI